MKKYKKNKKIFYFIHFVQNKTQFIFQISSTTIKIINQHLKAKKY